MGALVGTYAVYQVTISRGSSLIEPHEEALSLLVSETDGLIHAPSVSTITFFNGTVPTSFLRDRISEIVRLNPWLSSRLKTIRGKGLTAVYPRAVNGLQHIRFVSDETLQEDLPYDELMSKIGGYLVEKGENCIGKDKLQFLATVIETDRKSKKFALVFSLSHVIGDGHTFYSLYSMLDASRVPSSLIPERRMRFMEDLDRTLGPGVAWTLQSPAFIFGLLYNLFFRPVPRTRLVKTVSASKVAAIKQQAKARLRAGQPGSFVSTNDVITAWFAQTCRSDFTLMAINLRNRMHGYTDAHAGNYESVMIFSREDAEQPAQIRDSLARMRTASGRFPSILQLLKYDISCVTNWASFFTEASLPDTTHQWHLPLVHINDCIFRDYCIIFSPRAGFTSLLLSSRNVTESDLRQAGSRIFEEN